MITAEALTKQRGGRAVVSDVTFRCEPGTITAFLGPNGARKTTTMRMLVGLDDAGARRRVGREEVLSATQWAQAGTALPLWMLLPLLTGIWRITRQEVAS
jgi:ABC-type multidrug transport system ATPase subunit